MKNKNTASLEFDLCLVACPPQSLKSVLSEPSTVSLKKLDPRAETVSMMTFLRLVSPEGRSQKSPRCLWDLRPTSVNAPNLSFFICRMGGVKWGGVLNKLGELVGLRALQLGLYQGQVLDTVVSCLGRLHPVSAWFESWLLCFQSSFMLMCTYMLI